MCYLAGATIAVAPRDRDVLFSMALLDCRQRGTIDGCRVSIKQGPFITNRLFRVCLLPYSAPYIPRIPRIIPRYSAPRLIPRLVILGSRNTRNGARNARNAEFRDLAVSFFATAYIDLSTRPRPSTGTRTAGFQKCASCASAYARVHICTYIYILYIYIYIPWYINDAW